MHDFTSVLVMNLEGTVCAGNEAMGSSLVFDTFPQTASKIKVQAKGNEVDRSNLL